MREGEPDPVPPALRQHGLPSPDSIGYLSIHSRTNPNRPHIPKTPQGESLIVTAENRPKSPAVHLAPPLANHQVDAAGHCVIIASKDKVRRTLGDSRAPDSELQMRKP